MPDQLKPPSAASRLLSWIRDPYLPEILGDLDEEYCVRARSLGAAAARRWYWRESMRNAWFLLRRKRIVGTALIAALAVLSVNILFEIFADVAWRIWMAAWKWPYPAQIRLSQHYRPLVYQQSWGMGWPPLAYAFVVEIALAPIVGFAVGYLFALVLPERAKQMRIAAAVLWSLQICVYSLWLFGVVHFLYPTPAHGSYLLVEFLAREITAAGAFFVGAGVGMARRKSAVFPRA